MFIMKKNLILFMSLLLAFAASAQISTKTFKMADFTGVKVNGPMDVECVKDAASAGQVVVTAENVKIDFIEVKVADGVLQVGMKKNSDYNGNRMKIRVLANYGRYIDQAVVNGAGSIKAAAFSNPNGDVDVKVNGSGDVEVNNVLCAKAAFVVNGSGDIDVTNSVKATTIEARCNGSGDLELESIAAKTVDLSVNGSGDVNVNVCDAPSVSVACNGSGDIEVDRIVNATSVNANLNGSGDIELGGKTRTANYVLKGAGDMHCSNLKAEDITITKRKDFGDISYDKKARVNIQYIND